MSPGRWSAGIMVRCLCFPFKLAFQPCHILQHALYVVAYHAGWAFTGDGTCTKIPQGGDPANPRSCAVAYPSTEKQELLWVKLTPLASGTAINTDDIPIIPEVEVSPQPLNSDPLRLAHALDIMLKLADLCHTSQPIDHTPDTRAPDHSGRRRMGPKSQFQHPQVGKPCTFSTQTLLCASEEACI